MGVWIEQGQKKRKQRKRRRKKPFGCEMKSRGVYKEEKNEEILEALSFREICQKGCLYCLFYCKGVRL